jgi:hypothetical protein
MRPLSKLEQKKLETRQAAENDLEFFIRLVSPNRMLGSVHCELLSWWTRQEKKSCQLTLLPRDHQKSAMIAYRVAWWVIKTPDVRILYISATSNLAEKQLKMIKDILTSDKVRYYWSELINPEEGKREKWTNSEISIDHPKRKEEGVRDPTIFTGGLTTSLTGLHCDVAVLDDVVVPENAYTEEGRSKVKSQYSLLASIESTGAQEWVVGTRYHPKDLYNDLIGMAEDIFSKEGEVVDTENVYEVFQKQVESNGDGSGEFLWARQQRTDGKWFGFNREELARKKAKYLDKTQFRAQYYNDPNDPEKSGIKRNLFQYYDKVHLRREGSYWYYKQNRLNVFAAIDFAYSLNKRADYTALVIIGLDSNGIIYILDIDRFKTESIKEYFEHILNMHVKWDFRKLRAEITSAQNAIVQELKNSYIRVNGLSLSIDEHSPHRHSGNKEERMKAILNPRYENLSIFHYKEGNCQILEDELVVEHPPHDDVKDALASAIEIAVPPTGHKNRKTSSNIIYSTGRFGGVVG